ILPDSAQAAAAARAGPRLRRADARRLAGTVRRLPGGGGAFERRGTGAPPAVAGGGGEGEAVSGWIAGVNAFAAAWSGALWPVSWLLLLWLAGLGWGIIRLLRAWIRLRRLAQSWLPAADPALLENVRRISERLGLRKLPAVRLTEESAGPMVAEWVRPVLALS